MERLVYPKGEARRKRDRLSKRVAKQRADKRAAKVKAQHKSDKEAHSELRAADKMAKPSTASPQSGRRSRKIARKRKRPVQVVSPKQGIERLYPLFTRTQYIMLGIDYRDFCHETRPSYVRGPNDRVVTGKNAPVPARVLPEVFKYPLGHRLYRRAKSVYDQPQPDKGHEPHERPDSFSLVRRGVLKLLASAVKDGDTTRTVPNRYVDKGGVPRVELFEIPVQEYSDPDSVSVDYVNRDEPGLDVPDNVTFEDGSEKVRYVRKNNPQNGQYVMAKAKSFTDVVETRGETRARRVLISKMHKEMKNDNVVFTVDAVNANDYSYKPRHAPLRTRYAPVSAALPTCRGVKTKKQKRLDAAIVRDMDRRIAFDVERDTRDEARELGEKQLGYARSFCVAEYITAFDNQEAKPVDPAMAGKKAAKLAAFKAKQGLHMEAMVPVKQRREERKAKKRLASAAE